VNGAAQTAREMQTEPRKRKRFIEISWEFELKMKWSIGKATAIGALKTCRRVQLASSIF
jgi:hypothetical protein